MSELASQTAIAPSPWTRTGRRRWEFPLTIKAILLDLDGTIMPSYKTLGALQYVDDQLAVHCPGTSSFIRYCLARSEFHSLLHNPTNARRAAIDYACRNNIRMSPAVLRTMSGLQEQSFCLYDGLRELLDLARSKGVFIGIYTSTSYDFAIWRMHAGLLLPGSVDALWAGAAEGNLINAREACAPLEDYARILIPYCYRKPDDTPLREISDLCETTPREILFVGEGVNDLEVTYRDWTNPRAIFCFQQKGAVDICERISALNAYLRPGHAPLGVGAVNCRINQYGVERDIIRLANGFIDLLDLIDVGRIRLAAPRRTPVVANNRLTLGLPCRDANSLRSCVPSSATNPR